MDLSGPAATILVVIFGLGTLIWYVLPDKWKQVITGLWNAYEEVKKEESEKKDENK